MTQLSPTPSFAYRGRDAQNKPVKGVVEAPSERSARTKLASDGIYPTSLTQKGAGTGLNTEIKIPGMGPRVKTKDLAVASRQLATMLDSGVSLLRALSVVGQQAENRAMREVLSDVAAQVEQGASFSASLKRHPKVFPPLMTSMVEAGELGGFLDRALTASAENFEKTLKLQNEVKAALTYPIVVLIIAVLAVTAMLLFIVPVFENMFADFGGNLPAPTQFLVDLSHVMPFILPPLVVVIVALVVWWRAKRNTVGYRSAVDPIKLKLPVFGKLFRLLAVARFARNFATLLGTGVPMLQSLQVVGETAGNYEVERALQEVQEDVRKGGQLGAGLARHPIFPEMLTQMVAIGEESGSADAMLAKAADFYDGEVETMTKQLSAILEPVMIVLLAGLLGFMIVALYLPMFSIFNEIQG
jgi:type IV pilus assembly protein PilC